MYHRSGGSTKTLHGNCGPPEALNDRIENVAYDKAHFYETIITYSKNKYVRHNARSKYIMGSRRISTVDPKCSRPTVTFERKMFLYFRSKSESFTKRSVHCLNVFQIFQNFRM